LNKIYKINEFDQDLAIQALSIINLIDNKDFKLTDYINYLLEYAQYDGVFVVMNDGVMQGLIHCVAPMPILPEIATVLTAVSALHSDNELNEGLLLIAEEWMRCFGAKRWQMNTKRSGRAFMRKYELDYIHTDTITMGKEL
jgi:hypothetical protein